MFFGPDTYRFAQAISGAMDRTVGRAVDIGCGAGPGAILIARDHRLASVFAVDINDHALALTRVNATLAGVSVEAVNSNLLTDLPGTFDLIVANRHDEIAGPNVVVVRTALHRATSARLAAARTDWAARLIEPAEGRPLVAVLLGGSNGRFRLDVPTATSLADDLARMMDRDRVALFATPSRRTSPETIAIIRDRVEQRGGVMWNGAGENPYFGLLATAALIVVTADSISMVSEAAATSAPVLVAALPGRSRRISLFLKDLQDANRIRPFIGRFEPFEASPLDDTAEAGQEMRRRLGL